jgi:hypothetical protein
MLLRLTPPIHESVAASASSKPQHDRGRYCISITTKYSIHVGHQHKRMIMHARRTSCTHGLEPSDGECKQI